ncbi:hypothetical protein PPACK8108_LOCUS9085, partial [Phakopsora pachyrhizi]
MAPIVDAYAKASRGTPAQLVQPEDIKREEKKPAVNQVNQMEMLEISPELFEKVTEELSQQQESEEDLSVPAEYQSSYGMLEFWDPPEVSSNHFETNYFLRRGRTTKVPETEPQKTKEKKAEEVQESEFEEGAVWSCFAGSQADKGELDIPGSMPSSSKKIKQALERIEQAKRAELEKAKQARIEEKKKQQQKEEAEIFKEAEKIRKELEEAEEQESKKLRAETNTSSQEEAVRRIRTRYLRGTAKDNPDTVQTVLKRILDSSVSLSVGELTVVSPTVAEEIKKAVSKRKVPDGQPENNSGEDYRDVGPTEVQESDEALELGIPVVSLFMKLRGIGGHTSDIVGVAENTPVTIAGHERKAHFFIAKGAVHVCLGRPFLVDYTVGSNFFPGKGEIFSFEDEEGKSICFPICNSKSKGWEKDLPEGVRRPKDNKTNFSSVVRGQRKSAAQLGEILSREVYVMNGSLGLEGYKDLSNNPEREGDLNEELAEGFASNEQHTEEDLEEEPDYIEDKDCSVIKDFPGFKLMNEDFGLILPSVAANKFYYDLWYKGRERNIIRKELIGQWEDFKGWKIQEETSQKTVQEEVEEEKETKEISLRQEGNIAQPR